MSFFNAIAMARASINSPATSHWGPGPQAPRGPTRRSTTTKS